MKIEKNIVRVGIYARVSTADQQTLSMQIKELKEYAKLRKWHVVMEAEEVGSAVNKRPKRELLLKAARQRKIDNILVWKLDRWGRSLTDVFGTLDELNKLGVGFVSLTEALDLNTITGTAMAGLLTVFAKFERDILRERVKAGIAHARAQGKPHGRPKTVAFRADEIKALFQKGYKKAAIARELNISRTSVRRMLKKFEIFLA